MAERFPIKGALFMMLSRASKSGRTEILLQLRQNTGYMDGKYDFSCSGHLEKGETLEQAIVREAKEELGVSISASDVQMAFFGYDPRESYIKVVFRPTVELDQVPRIMEPDKCSELRWFSIDELPENIPPFVKLAIQHIASGTNYATL